MTARVTSSKLDAGYPSSTLLGTLAVPSHCIYMFFDKMSLNCFIVYLFYTFFHTNMGEVKFVASWDQ